MVKFKNVICILLTILITLSTSNIIYSSPKIDLYENTFNSSYSKDTDNTYSCDYKKDLYLVLCIQNKNYMRKVAKERVKRLIKEETQKYFKNNILYRAPIKNRKIVYLTVDDGPSKYLHPMIELFDEYNIKVTFFFIGSSIYKDNDERVLEAAKKGHFIAGHTMNHPDLRKLSYQKQESDILNAQKRIENLTGHKPSFFRAPYGAYNSTTKKVMKENNLRMIYWSIDTRDWALAKNPQKILDNTFDNLHNGAIILIHERSQTLKILPELIEGIKKRGYEFETLRMLE